jgi:hypothetical protein
MRMILSPSALHRRIAFLWQAARRIGVDIRQDLKGQKVRARTTRVVLIFLNRLCQSIFGATAEFGVLSVLRCC